ncbi:hypothetical protein M3J09_008188 [Ascochyta lentis]
MPLKKPFSHYIQILRTRRVCVRLSLWRRPSRDVPLTF